MKKNYMKPATVAMKIETASLMAGSLEKDGSVEITNEDDLLQTSRRQRSVWDDDEE